MVAITGATGLLGGHILDKFLAEGVSLIALCRSRSKESLPEGITRRTADVLDQASLREALEGATTVVHAAAFVSFNPRQQKKIFEVNVNGTRNIVDTCLQLGIRNFVHVSSVSALGRKPGEEISEESKWNGLYTSDYAESKYLAELEVFRGAEEGMTVSIVNPSVILTASQTHRSSGTLFNYSWNETPFYTDGSLNYVDARDVAEAVYQLYKNPRPGEKFILSANSLPYRDFFQKVATRFNKRPPSIKISPFLSYWAGWAEEMRSLLIQQEPIVTRQSARMAIQSFQYNNKKARVELGIRFRPLEETLDWCCDQYLRNVKPNK